MAFIPKPPTRESILIFGDGDEAVFGYIGNSTEEEYYLVHFIPTKKMAWAKQIQPTEYDTKDRWIKKKYRKDLCEQLSFDPDFPMWLIFCDYHGKEDTPLFNVHKELVLKNRDLDRQIRILRIQINRMRLEEAKKAMHPDEWLDKQFAVAKKAKETIGEPIVIQQQQPSEYQEET